MRIGSLAPLLLVHAFGFSLAVPGTTIVGVWTDKKITIAADSKQTVVDSAGKVRSQTGCKVYEVRHLIFALAGLAQADQVSVIDEIRNSTELREEGTDHKLPVDSVVVGAMGAVVKVLRGRRATTLPNDTIQLLLAGKIDGKLRMYREEMSRIQIQGDFVLPGSSRNFGYPESRGHDGTDPNRGIEIIGISDTARRFQAALPEWNKGDDVSVASRLVAIEASDTSASEFVGVPISAIVIDKKGNHWIHKGACTWEPAGRTK
jgi:hypothetical protein